MKIISYKEYGRALTTFAKRAHYDVANRTTDPSVISSFKNLKTSTKKLLGVSQWIRGMTLKEAIMQTTFHKKKSAHLINALLRKAQHNAAEALQMDRDRLIVSDCWVGKGQSRKEIWIHAKGKHSIRTRHYAHVWVKVKPATDQELRTIENYQEYQKTPKDVYWRARSKFARMTSDTPSPETIAQIEEWQAQARANPNKVEEIVAEAMKEKS